MIPDSIIPKAQRLYDFAVALGYSHASAIGVCANVMAESSFNEGASEVGGAGFGLGQWTPQSNLTAQAQMLGYTYAESLTFDVQCDILLRGDETGQWSNVAYTGYDSLVVSPQTLSQFKKESDMISATMNYMAHWERPSYDPSINHKERRKDYAREFDSKLDGSGGGGGGDGTQLAVLPCWGTVYITQAEGGDFSHLGSLSVDFAYPQTKVPLYAPFDMTCKYVDLQNAFTVWQSDRPVKCADGSVSYVTFNTGHSDDTGSNSVGDKKKKGQVYAHTGTSGNVTGDHTHIECSKGEYTAPWATNSAGRGSLPNPDHMYNVFSSCNNVTKEQINIINQTSTNMPFVCILNWDDGGSTPPEPPTGKSNLITLLMVNALNGWYNY